MGTLQVDTGKVVDEKGFYVGHKLLEQQMNTKKETLAMELSAAFEKTYGQKIYDWASVGLQEEYAKKQADEASKYLEGEFVKLSDWRNEQYWVCCVEGTLTDGDLFILHVRRIKDEQPTLIFRVSKETEILIVK